MAELKASGDRFELLVTDDKFTTIKNCINEALEALGEDFPIRVGATRQEAIELLDFLLDERERLEQGTPNEVGRLRQNEAQTLREIGALLSRAEMSPIDVTLPIELAERAVAASRREDLEELSGESAQQKRERHHAGTLALIGCTIEESGDWSDDEVVVTLDPVILGLAVSAADD